MGWAGLGLGWAGLGWAGAGAGAGWAGRLGGRWGSEWVELSDLDIAGIPRFKGGSGWSKT